MQAEDAEVKKLAELKTFLEQRLSELEREAESVKSLLEIIDRELVAKSFKKAQPPAEALEKEPSALRTIRSRSGALLATMSLKEKEARIVFNPEIRVTQDMRPFSSFLLRKVLDSMREADLQKVAEGRLDQSNVLTYEVVYDGDVARELVVKNFREEARLREIVNSVKWTLDTIASSYK
ncbi:MAG: hypothetical protein N3H84_01480 [Candidatus Caldarchaeum sp.]|nr:hypothetical protein [Candidatus Caldarchaeum sp.]MCX8200761.1 hypothetical protein [Candidatus Caldarchaeum sp.]MDW8434730.1 hypothetical protein [Candidatus Caldarchaeum sp.]